MLTHHNLLNNTVEIDGDTAHSETYYQFVARNHAWDEGSGEPMALQIANLKLDAFGVPAVDHDICSGGV